MSTIRLWLLMISLAVNLPRIVGVVKCYSVDDCRVVKMLRRPDYEICGFCNDKGYKRRGFCEFPFAYYFTTNYQCERVDPCPNNCNSKGRCDTRVGCICAADKDGIDCSITLGQKVPADKMPLLAAAYLEHFLYEPGVPHISTIKYMCNHEYKEDYKEGYKIVIEDNEGFYSEVTINDVDDCTKDDNIKTIDFSYSIPFRVFDIPQFHYSVKGLVHGYPARLTVKFLRKNEYEPYFQSDIPVVANYLGVTLTCVPEIKLYGCGRFRRESYPYRTFHNVHLTSNIDFIEDGSLSKKSYHKPECESSATYTWSVWLMDNRGFNRESTPNHQVRQKREIEFAAYTLDPGHYVVELEVNNIQTHGVARNRVLGHFKVIMLSLRANIEGGLERTVQKRFGIKLRCYGCEDPNSPLTKQDRLFASWYCEDLNNNELSPAFCKQVTTHPLKTYYVAPEKLEYGKTYRFYLKLWTDKWSSCTAKDLGCQDWSPVIVHSDVTVDEEEDERKDSIIILCISNCEAKVLHTETLLLKATTLSGTDIADAEWSYGEDLIQSSVKDIAIDNVPSFMLLVDKNKLEMSKSYRFVVSIKSKNLTGNYRIETYHTNYEGECNTNPTSGIRGDTMFSIECTSGDSSLSFEFYDKSSEEALEGQKFSGRMLGVSFSGKLQDIRLSRGHVFIYIVNSNGLFDTRNIDMTEQLLDKQLEDKDLEQMLSELTNSISKGNKFQTLRNVSLIPDIIAEESDRSKVLNNLLSTISKVPIKFVADVKMTTLTLSNVLTKLNKPTQLNIKANLMMSTMELIHTLTKKFSEMVFGREAVRSTTNSELLIIAQVQLNALRAALLCQDQSYSAKDTDFLSYKTVNYLIEGSKHVEQAINYIQDVLGILQPPGIPATKVSTSDGNIDMWAIKNDQDYPFTNYLTNDTVPVAISQSLMMSLDQENQPAEDENLVLKATSMRDNIFCWGKSDVLSNLVSVSLSRKRPRERMTPVKRVSKPLNVHLQLDDGVRGKLVSGYLVQPDEWAFTVDELDLRVNVHRLDPKVKSLTTVKFLYPQTSHALRVFVDHLRPDYETMINKSSVITKDYPTYPTPLVVRQEDEFVFVGILPAKDVAVNESVFYTFETSTRLCQYWATGQWSSLGCQIADTSKDKDIVCECDHLSIFAAAFPVPPQQIDPFSDAVLFLTVFSNPLVVSFVIILLLIYLILCLWGLYKDRAVRHMRNVVVLEDNFPGDSYPYLLAVYTSSRFSAGTTAHVGVCVSGSLSSSRAHILNPYTSQLLTNGSDIWFLMFCKKPLGELENIHVWHDNTGSSPDWFLNKIVVFHLAENIETTFVFERWLSLQPSECPESLATPTTRTDVKSVKRMFLDNFVFGLSEEHGLLSVLQRHPRSKVSRLERISVVMTGIMVAMLCSIMFYSPPEEEVGVDDSEFFISKTEFLISIQSLVISIVVTFLVLYFFKRSVQVLKPNEQDPSKTSYSSIKTSKEAKKRNIFNCAFHLVISYFKSSALGPVQMELSEPVEVTRKAWCIIAWTLCVTIILSCSYLVMLYGLKMGAVKSQKWLTSLLFTMGEDIFFQAPMKIILISLFLSLTFQRVCEKNIHKVTVEDVQYLNTLSNRKQLDRLVVKRSHQMYAPLRTDARKVISRKIVFRDRCWAFIDFCISVVFLGVVSAVIVDLWSSHYFTNSHVVKDLTTANQDYGPINFYDMSYVQDFEDFLRFPFIRSLYVTRWYNGRFLDEFHGIKQYWNKNFVHKMLGLPMLRQLRVQPYSCWNIILTDDRLCLPGWRYGVEDIGSYGVGWENPDDYDLSKINSAWIHKERSTSILNTFYRLHGASGRLYATGGFSTTLGPTRQKTELTLLELKEFKWQDVKTKAVFVEFTLYNVNLKLFTQVTLIVEYLNTGRILRKAQATSVSNQFHFYYWHILFMACFIFYVVRTCHFVNRSGFLDYFRTWRNLTRILVLGLSIPCIFIQGLHIYYSTKFHAEFQQQTIDSYFDFDVFVYDFLNLQDALSLLFCVSVLRMMILFRGGRRIKNYWYTVKLSLSWVIWLTLMNCGVIVLVFSIILLLNINRGKSVLQLAINPKVSRLLNPEEIHHWNIAIFIVIKTVLLGILNGFYVLTFMYKSRIAKDYHVKNSDSFSFHTFLFSIRDRLFHRGPS